jgi:CHASE2 domain-containing sensor protein
LFLSLLLWLFGRLSVLHKLETVVMDAQMKLSSPPADSMIVTVDITDENYKDKNLFNGNSPLKPEKLKEIIDAIARGEPAVIGVDIDTSSPQFQDFKIENWKPHIVWEREVEKIPENTSIKEKKKPEPLGVLGGTKDLDPANNSTGVALLIDDEDNVTRRYRRLIPTTAGDLPSFPWAVVTAFLKKDKSEELDKIPGSTDDLLIMYFGDRSGSHRLRLTASTVLELSRKWPDSSPIKKKIVLLGGSYLDQDRHDTPLGRMNGLYAMANVVETELVTKLDTRTHKVPSKLVVVLLEFIDGFVLIWLFHVARLRYALLWSLLLVPAISLLCSLFAYGNWTHPWYFVWILIGLVVYELYEHYRRSAVPRLHHEITRSMRHE